MRSLLTPADIRWSMGMSNAALIDQYERIRTHLIKNLLLGHPMPRTTETAQLLRAEIEARGLKVPES